MNKVILWDFDGTLGYRQAGEPIPGGSAWSSAMHEAVKERFPDSHITLGCCIPHVDTGFPWHHHEKAHIELNTPDLWWEPIKGIFAKGFACLGFSEEVAVELAESARRHYLDLSRWSLFQDTLPTLRTLSAKGWRHVIVSNHVPELATIIAHLGLTPSIDHIVNSADVGYEKPQRQIYARALELSGHPETVWMVGDNYLCDVATPEALSIPAILVRNRNPEAERFSPDLAGVVKLLP